MILSNFKYSAPLASMVFIHHRPMEMFANRATISAPMGLLILRNVPNH